jgi:glycosyltransferase involved in cell wall biosynthesis
MGLVESSIPTGAASARVPISVVILTHNEEINIAQCLESCGWCDDVHVIDSGSSDRTVEIARKHGAQVHEHVFVSFGEQRNWAIDQAGCRYRWQFHLDADERFTSELVAEMGSVIDGGAAGYLVPSKLMFRGAWLRRSSGYPVYQMRLIDSQRTRFVDVGHGQREQTSGSIGTLREPYLHYAFSHGLAAWFAKHNQYSSDEARAAMGELASGSMMAEVRQFLFSGGIERRRAAKRLSYRVRGRRWFRFVLQYILHGGYRDGPAGLVHARLLSMYESWIERKMHGDVEALSKQLGRVIEAAIAHVQGEAAMPGDVGPFAGDYRRMISMLGDEKAMGGEQQ